MSPTPRLPRTVAVLLGAGSGSRFTGGGHKLLAEIDGRSVYLWALEAVTQAAIGPVVLITGAIDLPAPNHPDLITVHNPLWPSGLASSLQAGLGAAQKLGAEAVVVGLADQPLVTASAWQRVSASSAPIAVATYNSKHGNPVRLHAEIWSALPTTGDEGARSVVRVHTELVEEVPCEGSSKDIDTLEDLAQMKTNLRKNR